MNLEKVFQKVEQKLLNGIEKLPRRGTKTEKQT